jgi:hypothetical protein
LRMITWATRSESLELERVLDLSFPFVSDSGQGVWELG